MSDWVEISRKKTNVIKKDIARKSSLNIISSKKPISSDKEYDKDQDNKIKSNVVKPDNIDSSVKNTFEDAYGYHLEDNFNTILNDLKPHSILLNNISRVDIEDFFYDFFDIENSVKRIEIKEDKKVNYYSDEEYY